MTPGKFIKLVRRASKAMARLLLYLVCVFPFISGPIEVKAQAGPVMLLSSNPVTFFINDSATQTVDLLAQNVTNMKAFEFVLSYDPAFLEFVEVKPSTWLGSTWNPTSSVSGGTIHYAYAQLGGLPVSGSGVLATITFKPIAYGNTQLTFSDILFCKYSNNLYQQFQFAVQPSAVNIIYNSVVSAYSTVVGTFSLQGQTTTGGVPVTLAGGDYLHRGPFSSLSLNQSGSNFTINPVVMDVYTVTTNQPRYLNIDEGCGKSKPVFATTSTLSPLKLKGGNAVWTDNEINMQDISKVLGVYGEASTLSTPLEADINFNGRVDVYDLAMVAGNYGLTCAIAYANWVP